MASNNYTPNLPTNITPTNIAGLKRSGKFPMGLGIPPLKFEIMLELNPVKCTMLVGGLAVTCRYSEGHGLAGHGEADAEERVLRICIYIYIYICIYVYNLSLSLSLYKYVYVYMYIYIYIYVYTHTYVYIYIYIYIYREREKVYYLYVLHAQRLRCRTQRAKGAGSGGRESAAVLLLKGLRKFQSRIWTNLNSVGGPYRCELQLGFRSSQTLRNPESE